MGKNSRLPIGAHDAGRPGPLGPSRDAKYAEWDSRYGRGGWTLAWAFNGLWLPYLGACALYEDAYFNFLRARPRVLRELAREASEVYDTDPSNVFSGYNYTIQEGPRTHIQDIAIRRSMLRLGARFHGRGLVRIRDREGTHRLSMVLSPGQVPFHMPRKIERPELKGWWRPRSVESFYQSNKHLLILSNGAHHR